MCKARGGASRVRGRLAIVVGLTLVAGLGGSSAGGNSAQAAEPRASVLFIMADDLKTAAGCYGDPMAKTPHIDRLAARGVRFDRAYCQYPVCNPSRTSMLSGIRPETSGVVNNVTPARSRLPEAVFLPEHFRRHGYRALKVGKISHTGDEFEDPRSWDVDVRETKAAKNPPEAQVVRRQGGGGIVLAAEDGATWDGFVARKAVELLEQAAGGEQPFFLAAGFRRPHTPYIAPQKYFDLYPPPQFPPLVEPAEHLRTIPPLALTYKNGAKQLPPNERPDTAAAYYASVSFMDAQLGVLLDAVDRLKLWDRLIVVFTSDHGYHLGEHGGLWHKMTLFELATRVPLIVAAPEGMSRVEGKGAPKAGGGAQSRSPRAGEGRGEGDAAAPHAVAKGLVELVDLYPTLVELCGLPQPPGLEGTSFAPLLSKPDRPWKPAVFTVVSRLPDKPISGELSPEKLGRTVRTDRWRYTQWPDGTRELYDYRSDPHEWHNLAPVPTAAAETKRTAEQQSALDELGQLLHQGWRSAVSPVK